MQHGNGRAVNIFDVTRVLPYFGYLEQNMSIKTVDFTMTIDTT